MNATLRPGIRYEHKFIVPASKTVAALYPEADEFAVMPEVFATGFLVGFLEWACIKAINEGAHGAKRVRRPPSSCRAGGFVGIRT